MKNQLVLIRGFHSLIEANISKTRLEMEDMEVFLCDEYGIITNPLLGADEGWIGLGVSPEYAVTAKALLTEIADSREEHKQECSGCGLKDVKTERYGRSWLVLALLLPVSLVLGYPLARLKTGYACSNCGRHWHHQ